MMIGNIGVVGLGKMGLPMAGHLLRAGHPVAGYDPSTRSQDAAKAAGIPVIGSVAELVASSSCTLVVVGTDDQVLEVCCAEGGIVSSASAGHTIFLCSTVSPETAVEVGRQANAVGIDVLDATLCGGEVGAIEGDLLIMGAGPEDVLERWKPMFDSFAQNVVHLGDLGAGQIGKLVNNLLVWVAVVGNYEALRLGMRLGVDQEKLRSALIISSGDNPLMRTWHRPRPMPWAEDDMAIVMERADSLKLPMPMAGVVRELIKDIKIRKAEWGEDPESYESMFDFVESVEGAPRA
ncbi:MAG: Hgd 1 [Sphaerisporangium sp.]|jgi:3-hydroxyisobutyrate dehydrogenase-like beta-hydroxyacid dehydrogenase|nr:Hgd 1 [Sphaerisporangium sp.]